VSCGRRSLRSFFYCGPDCGRRRADDAGSDAALKTLEATPGFQFTEQQGDAVINAKAAAWLMLGP